MPDGAAIRKAREARGWSQRDLAERVKIGERDLALIEEDLRPRLPAIALLRIAMTLGATMALLMSDAEKQAIERNMRASHNPLTPHARRESPSASETQAA